MAYLLRYAGGSNRAQFSSTINITNVGDYIELDVSMPTGGQQLFGESGFSYFLEKQSNSAYLLVSPSQFTGAGYTTPIDTRLTLRLTKQSTTFTMTVNGSLVATFNNTGVLNLDRIGAVSGSGSSIDLYGVVVYNSGAIIHSYDPSTSNGTGTTITDSVGTNDLTLVSFTGTTNSWWVFYGSGAAIIAPTTIASAEAFGTSVITTGVVLIAPTVIPTEEIVGSPTITSGGIIIIPAVITSEELVGSPTVVPLGVILQPTVIVTEEVVGSPVLVTGIVIVLPTGIPSEEVVGEPFVDTLLKQIFPTEILSLEDVGRPIVLGGDSIIIPIPNRQTWNAVAKYLRELVFTGYDNDVIMKWLRSEGYEDAYNDNWDDYLLGQGYLTGALADRYSQWRQGVAGDDPWILSEGTWNDIKIWRDNENWRDS
jgi:hypothetical protein